MAELVLVGEAKGEHRDRALAQVDPLAAAFERRVWETAGQRERAGKQDESRLRLTHPRERSTRARAASASRAPAGSGTGAPRSARSSARSATSAPYTTSADQLIARCAFAPGATLPSSTTTSSRPARISSALAKVAEKTVAPL